jgi:hypothetical protein
VAAWVPLLFRRSPIVVGVDTSNRRDQPYVAAERAAATGDFGDRYDHD